VYIGEWQVRLVCVQICAWLVITDKLSFYLFAKERLSKVFILLDSEVRNFLNNSESNSAMRLEMSNVSEGLSYFFIDLQVLESITKSGNRKKERIVKNKSFGAVKKSGDGLFLCRKSIENTETADNGHSLGRINFLCHGSISCFQVLPSLVTRTRDCEEYAECFETLFSCNRNKVTPLTNY
jgi:hypothetical protein